jgi:hypothetical protein
LFSLYTTKSCTIDTEMLLLREYLVKNPMRKRLILPSKRESGWRNT